MESRTVQSVLISMSKIQQNRGQVEGLPANPRVIKDGKFDLLKKSIEDNPEMIGYRELLVYPHNGKYVIIGGNMRYAALKELGVKEVPCKVISKDATIDQLKAYVIKDNAGYGEWDFGMLEAEWNDVDVADWGVDIPTYEDMNESGMANDSLDELKEDDFDEEKEDIPPVTKRGDLFQLGEHRLMCGDSTSEEECNLLMGGVLADMVLTDPPFGNDLGYGRGQLGERRIANDENTDVLYKFFNPLNLSLKKDSHCLVWIQWRTFSELEKAFEKFKLRTVVIWDKMQAGLSGGGFAEQYEMLCVFIKGKATQNFYSGNVWQVQRVHERRENMPHPHQKPLEVLGKALDICSKLGDVVLDLFGGSGSTMMACEQMGRKCMMMELDPHYCDVIIARWEKLTGKKAQKIGNYGKE